MHCSLFPGSFCLVLMSDFPRDCLVESYSINLFCLFCHYIKFSVCIHGMHVAVRGQLAEVSCLLPLRGSQGLNPGCRQACSASVFTHRAISPTLFWLVGLLGPSSSPFTWYNFLKAEWQSTQGFRVLLMVLALLPHHTDLLCDYPCPAWRRGELRLSETMFSILLDLEQWWM